MSVEDAIPNDEEIRFLPDTPVVYLSMMRTDKGIPRGTPIWSSFEDKSGERSMENESMASTFLSLSKSISEMALDPQKDGKIIRLNVNQKTFNVYIPHPDDPLQVSFVIVFEETESVLVRDEYKSELVRLVVETLRSMDSFQSFVDDDMNIRLNKGDQLYEDIYNKIISNIKKWDNKRVKYLKKKQEEARAKAEAARKEAQAREEAKTADGSPETTSNGDDGEALVGDQTTDLDHQDEE